MTTLPSIESILMEIHQSQGGPSYQTKKKDKFVTGRAGLQSHIEMGREVLRIIFDALGMDDGARLCAGDALVEFGGYYKALELKTWTFDADQRQVLWMLLGYLFVPGLARRAAFWTLESPMDQNMPGGRFWYLPEPREIDGKTSLYLPVAQVVDWLLDLLDMSVEKFADKHSDLNDPNKDGLRRTLYNWRRDTVPDLKSVRERFPDALKMEFHGALYPDEDSSPAEQFDAALAFVKRKGLDAAERLRKEIPMTAEGRVEAILHGSASDEEKATFVDLLAKRYAAPSPITIRQYMLFARMVQDGYIRLLKALLPGVAPLCADPRQNKLLQIFDLYKFVYNLTIASRNNCRDQGEDAENAWFEAQLPPWFAFGPLLSILPSSRKTSIPLLAKILSRFFEEAEAGATLRDHFGTDELGLEIMTRDLGCLKVIWDEEAAADELSRRLKSGAPWQKLQSETRFHVVLQIVSHAASSDRIRQAAIERLRQLARTPSEVLQTIIVELDNELNRDRRHQTKETPDRVQALLDNAETSSAYGLWNASLLQYRAKHRLSQNDFEGAFNSFREARQACRERSYGRLGGEIARDCLAVALANQRLIQNDHEIYYRDMLNGGCFESEEPPRIEDVARSVHQYFWETLYRPYRGFEVIRPRSEKEIKTIAAVFCKLVLQTDQSGVLAWINDSKKLLQSALRDVEGNSVLIFLIKSRTNLIPRLRGSSHLETWRRYIGLLVQHGPAEQVNIPDFKRQTPLMLMAEAGDTELVTRLLQAGADPDKQDYEGRTALHAAIKSRVATCVDALLDHPCRMDELTMDGQSVLHTAVWSGNLHAVRRLLHFAPELAWNRNALEMTPLELAEYLIDDPKELQALAEERLRVGQRCATKRELEDIVSILEEAPVHGRT